MTTLVDAQAVAEAMRAHSERLKIIPVVSDDPLVVDEIVESIIGNNKGREIPKQKCSKCDRMITVNNIKRHMAKHNKRTTPYPRTACKYCGEMVGNNNISRHESQCPQKKGDVATIISSMIDIIGGINLSNIDEFVDWRDHTLNLANKA